MKKYISFQQYTWFFSFMRILSRLHYKYTFVHVRERILGIMTITRKGECKVWCWHTQGAFSFTWFQQGEHTISSETFYFALSGSSFWKDFFRITRKGYALIFYIKSRYKLYTIHIYLITRYNCILNHFSLFWI